MKNHESIAMGGRISCPAAGCLEIEWMLYPDVLEGCPDRYRWCYGMPPLYDQKFEIAEFEVELTAQPLGARLRHAPTGAQLQIEGPWLSREEGRSRLTVHTKPEVRFYGLGEQFASLDHTGRRIVCESTDWWNKNWFEPPGWKHSYAPIPFLLTTAGYGLLVPATGRVGFDLRPAGKLGGGDRYHLEVESSGPRLIFIPGRSLKEIIAAFVRLSGEPYIPPRWAQEPLLGCASNHKERVWNEAKLGEYIEMFQRHRIPNGMVMDECWTWLRKDGKSPTGHYMHYECYGAFEPDNYADPAAAIARLEREGRSRTIFIIGPFIGCKSKYLDMLKQKGWLVRRASNPGRLLMGQYNHYFLDFTHPEATQWWKERLGEVVDLGISGFFADFGEADEQSDALYHRGGTGRNFGQQYNLLYKQAVADVLRRKRGDDYYFIGRAGWTGVQAVSGLMQGDPQCNFEGMRQALISLQSSALTGQGVLSHNLGGYAGEQSALVYLRWIAFGIFCPLQHIWTSGESGGEPWNFKESHVLETYRTLMQWRMRLLPYLHSAMMMYKKERIPPTRPLLLEFPGDPRAAEAQDQFLCGPDLLVAPVMNADGHRAVYLPQGRWVDFWTDQVFEGPGALEMHSPLDRIPVLVAEGGIVPMEANPYFGRDLREEPLEIHVYGRPAGRSLELADQGKAILLSAAIDGFTAIFQCASLPRRRAAWIWRGCEAPASVRWNDLPLAESPDGLAVGYRYDSAARTLRVVLPEFPEGTLTVRAIT